MAFSLLFELKRSALCIVKEIISTSSYKIFRSLDVQPNDQVIEGLRTELERSLINNKNKRNQVAKLQEEMETWKCEVEKWRNKAQQAEKELQVCRR